MTDAERQRCAQRLELALERADFGIAMIKQKLCRMYPEESPQQIMQRLNAWLCTRPGAEFGFLGFP